MSISDGVTNSKLCLSFSKKSGDVFSVVSKNMDFRFHVEVLMIGMIEIGID